MESIFYRHGDNDRLNYLISNTDWNFINEGNVDFACEQFTSKFMEIIHECVLNKVVLIHPSDKPWYDFTIPSYTRKRDRLKRKAVRTIRTEDWCKYENMRNKVNNLQKYAKKKKKKRKKKKIFNNIENNLIKSSDLNPKAYWQPLRHFIKTNKNSEVIPPLKSI